VGPGAGGGERLGSSMARGLRLGAAGLLLGAAGAAADAGYGCLRSYGLDLVPEDYAPIQGSAGQSLVLIDWEKCYENPTEDCPTVKVAPGDDVLFKWDFYHDVGTAESAESYESCSGGFELLSGPVSGAGGEYVLTAPADKEELYIVCTVPGHCGTGQKLKIEISPGNACGAGEVESVTIAAENNTQPSSNFTEDAEGEMEMESQVEIGASQSMGNGTAGE